jgi:hypothetical protein
MTVTTVKSEQKVKHQGGQWWKVLLHQLDDLVEPTATKLHKKYRTLK